MIIDLTCPLELRGYEILHDDSDNVRAYIELYNLLDKRISQFDAVIRWIASDYGEIEETPFVADQLRASARSAFHISVSTQTMPLADRLEIVFLRICFEDESPEWLGDPDRLIDIDLEDSVDGRTLNYLMSIAGRDVVRFPRRTQDYWICVCGHVNGDALSQCRRCFRDKQTVLGSLSREAILLEKTPSLPETLVPEPIEPNLSFFAEEDPDEDYSQAEEIEMAEEYEPIPEKPKNYPLRNVIFLLTVLSIICASIFLWNWLEGISTRAKDVRPPVPTKFEIQQPT